MVFGHPLIIKSNTMEYKTLAMIRDSIINQLKPLANSDVDIQEEWIEDVIDDARGALVRTLFNARDDFSGWYQTVELEASDLKSTVINGYEYFFRNPVSVVTLPGPLMQGLGQKNILYFGAHGVDTLNMQRASMREFQEYEYHRFGAGLPCYMLDGDKLYLRNTGRRRYFKLSAIFSKPTCVPGYDIDNSDYPLPISLHNRLEIVVFQHLASKMNLPVDKIPGNPDETRIGDMNQAMRASQQESRMT